MAATFVGRRANNAVSQGRCPFLFRDGGSPAEYGAGMKLAIDRGWLEMHRPGTYVKFTPVGAELFP